MNHLKLSKIMNNLTNKELNLHEKSLKIEM